MEDAHATSMTLLEKIRSGDPDAWSRTVELYRPLLIYWCRRGGAGEEAEDLAQEIFLAAAVGIGDFRRDRPGDSFRGWLRGVARNKLLERLRRRGRMVGEGLGGTRAGEILAAQADPLGPGDEDPGEKRETRALYLRALELVRGEVEERTWTVFWRSAVDENSTRDVAAEFGTTTAAVRQAKSRVLRRLKEVVGDLVD